MYIFRCFFPVRAWAQGSLCVAPLGVWGFGACLIRVGGLISLCFYVFNTGRRINFTVFLRVFVLAFFQKYVKIRAFCDDNCENHAFHVVFPIAGSCVFSRVFEGSAD